MTSDEGESLKTDEKALFYLTRDTSGYKECSGPRHFVIYDISRGSSRKLGIEATK